MKTNELMIDDWVYYKYMEGKQEISHIFQISQIENFTDDYFVWGKKQGYGRMCHPEELEGIEITPEILKKNGFGYTEGDEELTHYYLGEPQFCKDMDLHIGTNNKGDFWLNTYNNDIHGLRYVHELQHALRICRIEKEIIL